MKLPKFYNPFKPHIVEFESSKFAVRKWDNFGWVYKEHTTYEKETRISWWMDYGCAQRWCFVDSLQEAVALLNKTWDKNKEKINSMKVVEVHG
jgi:hypothetical protein